MNNGGVYYTPLFYYESLWCLLGFIILIIIRKLKYTRLGFTTGGYLIWYSIGRFVFEGMRNSTFNLMLGNIKVAQLASIIMFIIGFMIILLQSRKPKLTEMYNSKEKWKLLISKGVKYMYDVIIIGMGPSGMSAALYAKRSNMNTLIIEKIVQVD